MSAREWSPALNDVFDVAADMAAAAVEAGDYSPAGPAREFAAERAARAMALETSVSDEMRRVYTTLSGDDMSMGWGR